MAPRGARCPARSEYLGARRGRLRHRGASRGVGEAARMHMLGEEAGDEGVHGSGLRRRRAAGGGAPSGEGWQAAGRDPRAGRARAQCRNRRRSGAEAAITRHEDEAGAQIRGEGAHLAVEVAHVEIVELEIAEHDIDRGQGGEPGEGGCSAGRDLDVVGVKEGGEDTRRGSRCRRGGSGARGWGRPRGEGTRSAGAGPGFR